MVRFVRPLVTFLAALLFAASSIVWASTNPIPLLPTVDIAAQLTGHDHAHPHNGSSCEPVADCTPGLSGEHEPDRHAHGDDEATACCALACHVIAEPAVVRSLAGAPRASCLMGLEPEALASADSVTLERPPRAG
jgi:hypothetical protein